MLRRRHKKHTTKTCLNTSDNKKQTNKPYKGFLTDPTSTSQPPSQVQGECAGDPNGSHNKHWSTFIKCAKSFFTVQTSLCKTKSVHSDGQCVVTVIVQRKNIKRKKNYQRCRKVSDMPAKLVKFARV